MEFTWWSAGLTHSDTMGALTVDSSPYCASQTLKWAPVTGGNSTFPITDIKSVRSASEQLVLGNNVVAIIITFVDGRETNCEKRMNGWRWWGCLNESYLSENRAPISSVQAADTLLGEDIFSLMYLLQPWTYTPFRDNASIMNYVYFSNTGKHVTNSLTRLVECYYTPISNQRCSTPELFFRKWFDRCVPLL